MRNTLRPVALLAAIMGLIYIPAADADTPLTLTANAATQKSAPDVVMTWKGKATEAHAQYIVYRDSKPLGRTSHGDYTDTTVHNGETHRYLIIERRPAFVISNTVTVVIPVATPSAPSNLTTASLWDAAGSLPTVPLTWNAVSGASSYNVYRDDGLLQAEITTLGFTDSTVTSGQTYTYTISAVGPGGESSRSGPVSATAPFPPTATVLNMPITLTPPTNVAVHGFWQGASSDTLTWDAVPGAVSYNVYLYDALLAKNVSGTTLTVPANQFIGGVSYTVTSVDSMGMESLPSGIANSRGGFDPNNLPGWVSSAAPGTPDHLLGTPEWNNGKARVLVAWQHGGDSYNVYRDGQNVARGLYDLYYIDNNVQPGETHSYTVSSSNVYWPAGVEGTQSAPTIATALTGPPVALAQKVQITNIIANDDSAQVFFQAVPGALDYRIYNIASPGSVKYAGRNEPLQSSDMLKNNIAALPATPTLSIEINGLNPATGADLVVEAVDKLGPFQKMDGKAGPGAMHMDGSMSSVINGQGDPSNVPNVLAKSDVFHVTCRPRTLTGQQVFFDNFRGSAPFTPVATLDPAIAPFSNSYFEINEIENDKWRIRTYGADTGMTRSFIMGSHFMDTLYDGPTAMTMPFSHNNNASLVMMPKATADISRGQVLHVTFEVDAHFDSRRWCDVFVGEAGDPLTHAAPDKLAATDLPTVKGTLLAWEIQAGTHALELIEPQTQANGSVQNVKIDLMQFTSPNDSAAVIRDIYKQVYFGTPFANGSTLDLDKRSRFDLYLSQNHYKISETLPDGVTQIVREKDFPAGVMLPFTQAQVYFAHELYHTGNDRPELVGGAPEESYWYNNRPWGDERHWDNMGFEVLPAFPQ